MDGPADRLNVRVVADAHPQTIGAVAAKNPRAAPVQESTTDQALKLRLNDALIFDPWLSPTEISLAVQDGHVKLTGSVETPFDSVRAADVVRRFSGVSSVENQLEVRKPGTAICLLSAP
jgi:osmotically-inducible protein OsmY